MNSLPNWWTAARLLGPSAKPKIFTTSHPRLCGLRALFIPCAVILSLSACSSQPTVGPPVYIKQTVYIPVPATLTQPISVDLTNATWGSAVGSLKAGLDTCNANLAAVAGLKPPPLNP